MMIRKTPVYRWKSCGYGNGELVSPAAVIEELKKRYPAENVLRHLSALLCGETIIVNFGDHRSDMVYLTVNDIVEEE